MTVLPSQELIIIFYVIYLYDLGISKEVKNNLLQNLRRDFPLEVAPVLLAPLIYPDNPDRPMDKINQDTSSISNTMVLIFLFIKLIYMCAYLCSCIGYVDVFIYFCYSWIHRWLI